MRSKTWEKGFTIFEILVTLAVAATISALIGTSVGKPARAMHEYQVRAAADSEARSALATVLNLLRSAVPGSVRITNDDPDDGASTNKPNTHISFIYRPSNQAAGTASPTYDIYLTNVSPAQIRMKATSANGTTVVLSPKTLASNVAYLQFNQSPADQTLIDVSLKISVPLDGSGRTHDVEILNQYVRVGSAP